MQIQNHIKNNKLKIIVKPKSPKNELKSFDKEKQALRVNIKAEPEKGKANREIIKFFTKLLKKRVSITSGLKSKNKTLQIQ